MLKLPSNLGFFNSSTKYWSLLTLIITGWLSFGPRPISDAIWEATSPQLLGEVPIVVRNSDEIDTGMIISTEIISLFASDNGVENLVFLDELFPVSTPPFHLGVVADLDGIVRRLRIHGEDHTIPGVTLRVPSITAAQLIQLRPDSLEGRDLVVAGAAGELQITTLSGGVRLWQAYANTASKSNTKTISPIVSFALAATLFFTIILSSTRTIIVACFGVCGGTFTLWSLSWLPPFDPMSVAALGGILIVRSSKLRISRAHQVTKLTDAEVYSLRRFTELSVKEHDCLAAWIVLKESPVEPDDKSVLKLIHTSGDTGAMSESGLATLLSKTATSETLPNPWSTYNIESPRKLAGSLYLITQPNDRHNRKSVADIASMVAAFCVTDSM